MFRKPGDIWIENFWSLDKPSQRLYVIKEMTGSGSFQWPMYYREKHNALNEIENVKRRVNYGRH